ncbi:unnamed protein product [Durusdinium trenchii]|uniref:Uncharacterized protein n=1 Tax=Durusdinium trenchii TaxID=1381693 RepID=A0ABP0I6V9_9DINO
MAPKRRLRAQPGHESPSPAVQHSEGQSLASDVAEDGVDQSIFFPKRPRNLRSDPFHAHLNLEDVPEGPRTAAESVCWAPRLLKVFKEQSIRHFETDFSFAAQAMSQKGIALRTDYSGLGSPEEAMSKVLTALQDRSFTQFDPSKFFAQRAGDLESSCRKVLMNHQDTFAPKCVHGDILDRCPPAVLQALKTQQKVHRDRAQERIDHGEQCKRACVEEGKAFVRFAVKCLKEAFQIPNTKEKLLKAHCYVHNRQCDVLPPLPQDSECLLLGISGVTCRDWSSMGNQEGWLGPSAFPFVQFIVERLLAQDSTSQEAALLIECTATFDDQLLAELLCESFELHTFHVTPALFGEPVDRQRKYMLLLNRSQLTFRDCVRASGIEPSFQRLFACSRVMNGIDKFRAPENEVKDVIAAAASKRCLPPHSSSGKAWSCFQTCTPAVRESILKHEAFLRRAHGPEINPNEWICNLSQDPAWMAGTRGNVPALLRRSNLWIMGKRRLAHPLELFEIQGFNIWGSPADANDEHRCTFVDTLRTLTEAQVKSMTGNSMHLSVLGAMFLFLLGCTVPTSPSHSDPLLNERSVEGQTLDQA